MLRRTTLSALYGLGMEKNQYIKVPGRKSLDDVCKLSLLEAASPAEIMNIWNLNHSQFVQYYGRVLPTSAYDAMRPRLEKCPYFLVPVFRDKGLFNAVTNFNNDLVGVVPLGEFQKQQDHATPHMTVQFFTELSRSKGLVLVRCEIQDKVFRKQDCAFVTQMLLKYYTMPDLYEKWIETFNKRPNQYDYHAFLRHMKDEAGKDNIDIKDKKSEMRADAYGSPKSAAPSISVPSSGQAAAIKAAHDKVADRK
jgi:hypothetical protein